MKVIKIENGSRKVAARKVEGCTELIDVQYFAVSRCDIGAGESYSVHGVRGPECVAGLSGKGVVVHEKTRVDLPIGQAVVIPACCKEYSVEGECSFMRCRVP